MDVQGGRVEITDSFWTSILIYFNSHSMFNTYNVFTYENPIYSYNLLSLE